MVVVQEKPEDNPQNVVVSDKAVQVEPHILQAWATAHQVPLEAQETEDKPSKTGR